MIFERKTKETADELIYEDRMMRFLYGTALGGLCTFFLRLPIVSRINGLFQKSARSQAKIDRMIDYYGIDMSNFEYGYRSFNDFIARKRIQTEFDPERNHLIAPADGCLLAYTIGKGIIFSIKDKAYTLSSFLKDADLAREYEGGVFLIFRLRVYDCHRFCFIDDGVIISRKRIRGFLDSVNQNVTGKFTLSTNYREISLLRTANFGDVVFAEIGAMLVGRIVQTHTGKSFYKGGEKGYFEFGGSGIVLLLKKGIAEIDGDIRACSSKGMETKVSFGERIGKKRVKAAEHIPE